MGPYAQAVDAYWTAGWRGLIPLPAGAKAPPPEGWTGRGAPFPSRADVQAWRDGREGRGNVGLRLPDGVLGLDVDDYDDRPGGATWAELCTRLGEPARTAVSTSRAWSGLEGGMSGIRLYSVPTGLHWPGQAGPGIEVIQHAHRYAVVWPSVHPEGRVYEWLDVGRLVPRPDRLRELPAAWVEYLTGLAGRLVEPAELSDGAAREWMEACRQGPLCPPILRVLVDAGRDLRGHHAGRHEVARNASRSIVAFAGAGHAGGWTALGELRRAFLDAVTAERGAVVAAAEWSRLATGAVRLAAADYPTPRQACDCELLTGAGLLLDPGPGAPLENNDLGVSSGAGDGGAVAGPAEAAVAPAVGLAEELRARMLTPADLRDRPGPTWLVKGLLTLESASWLIAKPSAYKSFVALDWAGHVAAGKPWMGHEVLAGGVIYVVAEGVAGMGPRIRAWEQRNGPMAETVRFVPFPVQAGNPEAWAALVAVCAQLRPHLVVLDTQARVTVGLDENDSTAMGRFVEAVEALKRASGACVLVVHHIGRNGTDARGSSAIDGAQDTELRMTRTADLRAVIEIDKSRHGRDDVRVEVELFPAALDGTEGETSLVVGPPLSSVPAGPDWRDNLTLNQQTVVDVVRDIFPAVGCTKAELWREVAKRPRRAQSGATEPPMAESSFRRTWDALVGAGRLAQVAGSQRFRVVEGDYTESCGVPE